MGVKKGFRFSFVLLFAGFASLPCAAESYQQQANAVTKAALATGQNSVVVQVEAPSAAFSGESTSYHYGPKRDNTNYKNIRLHIDPSAKASKHGDTVAKLLFGKKRSLARGITDAYIFSVPHWLIRLENWDLQSATAKSLFPGPIVNHSWVSSRGAIRDANLLRRLDWSAVSNNVLHVAGVRRQGAGEPLFGGSFNSLVVGGASKNISNDFKATDEFYSKGRYRPQVVGPFSHASAAAPVVAATAIRLNALATKRKLNIHSGRADSEQLPVELIKAIIMATASPNFEFSHKQELLVFKFGAFGLTPNGMDKRYGMGMIDVAGAEKLLMKAPTLSKERSPDKRDAMPSVNSGYSFDGTFGGASGLNKATYVITPTRDAELAVSLVWLARFEPDSSGQLNASLPNLELCLIDVTQQSTVVIHTSDDADTSENLRLTLTGGHTYELMVLGDSNQSQPWPYAIAWQTKGR